MKSLLTPLALAAVAASPALAQIPTVVVPRVVTHTLPGVGLINGLWMHDAGQTSETKLTHDAVLLRGDTVYHIGNLDGLMWSKSIATGVDAAIPLSGGTASAILTYKNNSGSRDLYFVDEFASPMVTSENLPTLNLGDVEELKVIQRSPTSYAVVAKRQSAVFHTALIELGTSPVTVVNLAPVNAASFGWSNILDWDIADKDNDGAFEIAVVGITDASQLEVGAFKMTDLGANTEVLPKVVLDSNPLAPAKAFLVANKQGMDNEINAVFQAAAGLTVSTIVDNTLNNFVLGFSGVISDPTIHDIFAAYAAQIGDATDGFGALGMTFDSSQYSIQLQRSGSTFGPAGRRLLKDGGCAPGYGSGEHVFAMDSNNSRAIGINSGDDYHTVTVQGRKATLRIVTGINNALGIQSPTSQNTALWTTDDYTDFIRDVRFPSQVGQVELKLEFNLEYFEQLELASGTPIYMETVVWEHDQSTATQFPGQGPAVTSLIDQHRISEISDYVGGSYAQLTLTGLNLDPNQRFTYYVEAKFHTFDASGFQQRGPTHLYGISTDANSYQWYRQLRFVASSDSTPADETYHSIYSAANKAPGGVKKPNGLLPIPPAAPQSPGVIPTNLEVWQ